MVKLRQGSNVLESELNAYFDYDNNFSQLLEDYLVSGDMEKIFNKGKSDNKNKFISNQRSQLKDLYEDGDQAKPRIKLFKQWMSNKYEEKQQRNNPVKIMDDGKDDLILQLQNELNEVKKNYDKTILNLTNENRCYLKKITKLKKQIAEKPKPVVITEPVTEPTQEVSVYDFGDDSDDDIVEAEPVSEPIVIVNKKLDDKEEQDKFIEAKKATANERKIKKDAAYELEQEYLKSLEDMAYLDIFDAFKEQELSKEEAIEKLNARFDVVSNLDHLKSNDLVNITRLKNKANVKRGDYLEMLRVVY
tara:strand:- start:58 stop:969 length:912 start_codon:yes stop_codon:yes gene_type:complete